MLSYYRYKREAEGDCTTHGRGRSNMTEDSAIARECGQPQEKLEEASQHRFQPNETEDFRLLITAVGE